MDEPLLTRLRSDLGDLRVYSDSGREVQYVLRTQRGARFRTWEDAKVLNRGAVHGETQFTIQIDVPEYDRIRLQSTASDFVARAKVEGADQADARTWNELGIYSIYDFSRERLGSSDTVSLASPVRYRYLRITVSGGVKPDEVEGVKVANLQEDKAQYVPLAVQPHLQPSGNRTIVSWNTSEKIPLERIAVEVDANEVNFSRDANIFCDERRVMSAELSRVRLQRKGREIASESLAIDTQGLRCKSYKLDIFNADNPPLRIVAVRPMMLERRIYFEPKGETAFKLYYGDEKTGAPQYDYARFFELADTAQMAKAGLLAEVVNPAYTPWPDDRPFSERYPAVLWVAMIVAIGLLGAWALKGFKS
jgi:hypothetical protein